VFNAVMNVSVTHLAISNCCGQILCRWRVRSAPPASSGRAGETEGGGQNENGTTWFRNSEQQAGNANSTHTAYIIAALPQLN